MYSIYQESLASNQVIEHNRWNDLSDEDQEYLLNRHINFQGNQISLKELLAQLEISNR